MKQAYAIEIRGGDLVAFGSTRRAAWQDAKGKVQPADLPALVPCTPTLAASRQRCGHAVRPDGTRCLHSEA